MPVAPYPAEQYRDCFSTSVGVLRRSRANKLGYASRRDRVVRQGCLEFAVSLVFEVSTPSPVSPRLVTEPVARHPLPQRGEGWEFTRAHSSLKHGSPDHKSR